MLSSRRCRINTLLFAITLLSVTTIVALLSCLHPGHIQVTTTNLLAAPLLRGVSTKSMSDWASNKTGVVTLSDHVVFFNRVPKSGSEMLVLLLQWMEGVNGYRHVRLGGGSRRMLNREEQEALIDEVAKRVRTEAIPVTFDRHVYFLNFTHFGRQSPVFINLVRDPVDKIISRYYYHRVTPNPHNADLAAAPVRTASSQRTHDFLQCVETGDAECLLQDGEAYDLTIPYFCGHEDWCMYLNDRRALSRAKDNVERYYSVVGVLEELNATLTALETRLPYFFRGVRDIYFNQLLQPHKNKNLKRPREISADVRRYLESHLRTEYEFYEWIKARLLRQTQMLIV